MRFRPAVADDLDELLDVQQAGAVLSLAHVFPQREHPFPREAIRDRWMREVEDPGTAVFVSTDRNAVTGFAATRGDELLHFGTAPSTWGSGLAGELHEAVLATFPDAVRGRLRLRVFEANARARRFYEKHGWRATGVRGRSSYAPNPVLLAYEHLGGASAQHHD